MSSSALACFRCLACHTLLPPRAVPPCPHCSLAAAFLDRHHDLQVPLNWQELRILAQWARNWLDYRGYPPDSEPGRVLHAVLERLQPLRPPGAAPLLLQEELAARSDAGEAVPLPGPKGALCAVLVRRRGTA